MSGEQTGRTRALPKQRPREAKRRQERIAAGLCVQCGATSEAGRRKCSRHLGRDRGVQRRSTGLTASQRRLLAFLQSAALPPTIREMCAHLNRTSNAIFVHLRGLERKGHVVHVGGKARATWRVVRPLPGVMSPAIALRLIRNVLGAAVVDADALDRVRAIAFAKGGVEGRPI
jgi:hypothetical protein